MNTKTYDIFNIGETISKNALDTLLDKVNANNNPSYVEFGQKATKRSHITQKDFKKALNRLGYCLWTEGDYTWCYVIKKQNVERLLLDLYTLEKTPYYNICLAAYDDYVIVKGAFGYENGFMDLNDWFDVTEGKKKPSEVKYTAPTLERPDDVLGVVDKWSTL